MVAFHYFVSTSFYVSHWQQVHIKLKSGSQLLLGWTLLDPREGMMIINAHKTEILSFKYQELFYFRRAKVLNLKTVSEDKGMEANKRKAENGEFGLKMGIFG